ncbi:MAG: hypothetical protein HRT69_09110 [Flavobacteriaceae bacterium]|nr:hypothetical protein [Flavobacteriaceae bacterium]
MKKLILAVVLLVTTITKGQNSLFSTISTTDQYEYYSSVWDEEEDGTYAITDKGIAEFETKYLPTGEGNAIKVSSIRKDKDNYVIKNSNVVTNHYRCAGYPYESFLKDKHERSAFVAIGDYVFIIDGISEGGTSFKGIKYVFIKKSGSTTEEGKKEKGTKKKKMSFRDKLKALKNATNGTVNYGPAHKKLESLNLDKLITDYLVAMKAKQNGRTAKQKQSDKNIVDARNLYNSDVNAYNDKIKASPEYKKMKAHQARMAVMDNNNAKKTVTINNKTGKDIYIYKEGSRNGTRINSNSSTKVDCSFNYTYKFDSNSNGSGSRCYSANTGCERSVTVN